MSVLRRLARRLGIIDGGIMNVNEAKQLAELEKTEQPAVTPPEEKKKPRSGVTHWPK